ncbi:FHA domain-containing protein [Apostasia shenzhenica]|uniref:FHA domain-containing protein n=1 Tax=Apostasia shenzhenica TaxID=1088818 RepID=A0A2I0A853_9ASPA|nr:FHA domain-containing protein [Apostasia shenzhenica]
MAATVLSLSVREGPRKGESFEYKIGTLIRIGRVVRGNTLAIRDPSISQNHLIIQFLPEITRWAVKDLGSSNGTYVNGSLISPDDPIALADGDVLVIGEKTSISVKISSSGDVLPPPPPEAVLPPLPRRGKARRSETVETAVLQEEKVSQPLTNRGSGRVSRGRSNRLLRKDENHETEVVEQRARRVTRSSSRVGSSAFSSKQQGDQDVPINISVSGCGVLGRGKKKTSKESHAGAEEEVVVGPVGETTGEQVEDDTDNMKLWQWFDRLATYLNNSINDVAEETIASISEKSCLFDEFIMHTANAGTE